jgi:hypothetical protein
MLINYNIQNSKRTSNKFLVTAAKMKGIDLLHFPTTKIVGK